MPDFCPPTFSLNPIIKNGSFLSVVALVSVTLTDSNPHPSAEKTSILAPTPSSSSLARTSTIDLPECQEQRGTKQCSPCFLRRRRWPKAGDAFTRTRLMPTSGVSAALSVEYCRLLAGNVQQKGRLRVQKWEFGCLGCFGVLVVFSMFRVHGSGCLGCVGCSWLWVFGCVLGGVFGWLGCSGWCATFFMGTKCFLGITTFREGGAYFGIQKTFFGIQKTFLGTQKNFFRDSKNFFRDTFFWKTKVFG